MPRVIGVLVIAFISITITILGVIAYSAFEVYVLDRRRNMELFTRNFYKSSEDDMRELEVVEGYCNRHSLSYHVNCSNDTIIFVDVRTGSEVDISFFMKYGFHKLGEN